MQRIPTSKCNIVKYNNLHAPISLLSADHNGYLIVGLFQVLSTPFYFLVFLLYRNLV